MPRFFVIDHFSLELVGTHAAKYGAKIKILEPMENLHCTHIFQAIADLRQGLLVFKQTCATHWRIGRIGYWTSELYREKLLT